MFARLNKNGVNVKVILLIQFSDEYDNQNFKS